MFHVVRIYSFKDHKSKSKHKPDSPLFPKEHCFSKFRQASPPCPSGKRYMKLKMNMQELWDESKRERTLSHCKLFVT